MLKAHLLSCTLTEIFGCSFPQDVRSILFRLLSTIVAETIPTGKPVTLSNR